MDRFIEGVDRSQVTLFPDRLEDWIDEDNPVRVIDVFVDTLDLNGLGFGRVIAAATGRPGYHPAVLLKLYVYGYLNRVQSSRRLEREAQRNIEVLWLTGCLAPDFKTIADFRKDYGKAIQKVCAQFIELCRLLDLFSSNLVAIDGSKFKAVNARDNNFTEAKMKKRLAQIEKSIAKYLDHLETTDRQEPDVAEARTKHLQEKIDGLKKEMKRLGKLEEQRQASPDGQISLTDPDSRSMMTSGRGSGLVGYNVQSAVDTNYHLIVAFEVTNYGHDQGKLASTAELAKQAMGKKELEAVADRGYYKGEDILACDQSGVTAYVAKPHTSGSKKAGLFGKQNFVYVAKEDVYLCPANERLSRRWTKRDRGRLYNVYLSKACHDCPLKNKCTRSKVRQISRWEHEDVLEQMQERLDLDPEKMRERRQTVEHPFGTIKFWMGATHFLMKTLPKVTTEMSLHVLAYNMTRVMNMLGMKQLLAAIKENGKGLRAA